MARVRKAVTAGLGAALSAALVGVGTEVPRTEAGWVALASAALGAGVVAGLATWRVRNTSPFA